MTSDGRIDRMRGRYYPPTRYDPLPYYKTKEEFLKAPSIRAKKKEVRIVSAPLWCDVDDKTTNAHGQSGHPFSSKDPERQNYIKRNERKDKYGDTIVESEEFDICGYHANGLFQPAKTPETIPGPKDSQ